MFAKLEMLRSRLLEIHDLRSAASVLHWDQATYMPPGGAAARGRQIATLSRLAHEKFTGAEIGQMLNELAVFENDLPPESHEASLIRRTRRDYERAVQVPPAFQSQFSNHSATIYQAWTTARPANDFNSVLPLLERTLDLSQELSSYYPGYDHIADPLIDDSDEGMTTAVVRELFTRLREELVGLLKSVTSVPSPDDSCLHRSWPEEQQFAFGRRVIEAFGYDFNRGRQDKTHHPFMTSFSLGDVRITTRAREDDISDALFSTLHEAGHALYEQGISEAFEGTPLAHGASSGVHESQSRLWENMVGRSRSFWAYWYPYLQAANPALESVSGEDFYRAINKVHPSLIRTDADELTYNLHVMIRFELELELLEGRLAMKDLPEAWNALYREYLGVSPADDRDGVLQDVHWFSGTIGGSFQGYTLGNVLAAAFYQAATTAHPTIPSEIEAGKYDTLRCWLTEHIYQHGRKFTMHELVQRVTGYELSVEPYIEYLSAKYGDLNLSS